MGLGDVAVGWLGTVLVSIAKCESLSIGVAM